MTYYIITTSLDQDLVPSDGLEHLATIASNNSFTYQSQWLVGSPTATPVDAVLLVQVLAAELDWFMAAVLDLRLLRVADDVDLSRAIFDYPKDDGPLTDEDLTRIKEAAAKNLPKGAVLNRESLFPIEVYESSNTYVKEHGLPLEKYRMF